MLIRLRLLARFELWAIVLAVFSLSSWNTSAATAPGTANASQAEQSRLSRGRQVRQILLQLLDQVDRDTGRWPRALPPAFENQMRLIYTEPAKLGDRGFLGQLQLVVHEPLERFPDGVWVGYADGHVEFAPTAGDLVACEGQPRIVQDVLTKYGNPWGPRGENHVDPKSVAEKLKGQLTIQVVDPEGRPVAGALAGVNSFRGDDSASDDRVMFYGEPKNWRLVTDSNGRVTLPAKAAFNPAGRGSGYLDLETAPLVVIDEARGLMALEEVALAEFQGKQTREVRLRTACHGTADLTSFGLKDSAQPLEHTEAFAQKPGMGLMRAVYSVSTHGQLDLLVPPGDYGIYISEHHCYPITRWVHVTSEMKSLVLHLDLPPRRQPSELVGHAAPELRGIKAWKNGGPVTLADLRGKVVVLDFWGCWCGPCNVSMPELMKLHDQYKDKGLVIIAVHDDSVESIAEMDQKLKNIRKEVWGGRDLPFLVALDGGGKTRIADTGIFTRGATNAAYHVWLYPTTFLIGKVGKVLRDLKINDPDAHADIEKTIAQLVNQGQ